MNTSRHGLALGLLWAGVLALSPALAHAGETSPAVQATGLATWGANDAGQLGRGGTVTGSETPVLVDLTGALKGKTVTAIAAGDGHRLALCADGTVAAWGNNTLGALGDGTRKNSAVPVLVDLNGELKGKKVLAIAAGGLASLALADDGLIYTWGGGAVGAQTDTRNAAQPTPKAVRAVALQGKKITALAAGESHALALLADGTIVAWGIGASGRGADPSNFAAYHGAFFRPGALNAKGALKERKAVAIAAAGHYNLARFDDGTSAVWPRFTSDLGVNYVPEVVDTHGVLQGRIPVALAGDVLVLCADGTLAGLGTRPGAAPALVDTAGVLRGKQITGLAYGRDYGFVFACADGTAVTWNSGADWTGDRSGERNAGRLRSAGTPPVALGGALAGRRVLAIAPGLALFAEPAAP